MSDEEISFDEALEGILRKDARYARPAYYFVRDGLSFTSKERNERNKTHCSDDAGGTHVTGQELLDGLRRFALEQYGPMACALLKRWGLAHSRDFGDIVYNLIEGNMFGKSDTDSKDDFEGGFDFESGLCKPFEPSERVRACVQKALEASSRQQLSPEQKPSMAAPPAAPSDSVFPATRATRKKVTPSRKPKSPGKKTPDSKDGDSGTVP